MLPLLTDPIAAIATAPGRGAVGIVRVSGADVSAIVAAVCGRVLQPRVATYLAFLDGDGQIVDRGLAIHFPGPHSYTGEDVLELQGHGGTVVLNMLLACCLQAGTPIGLRIARPGEFTERAFLNGKMDLAQAESVADLIDASTESAVRSANRSLSGGFSAEVNQLLDSLTRLRMLVEAALDFPEEDVDVLLQKDVAGRLMGLRAQIEAIQDNARRGSLLRDGIRVVIAGAPNAGKSSLLNALAGAELAIVSAHAGTTRDKLQQTIQISGVPVHVIDTAGLRDSDDEIERIGITRAWSEIESADAIILLHDLTTLAPDRLASGRPLCRADAMQASGNIASQLAVRLRGDVPVVDVWNKLDAVGVQPRLAAGHALALSAKTLQGLDGLRAVLLQLAGWQAGAEGLYMARQRHMSALATVAGHLSGATTYLRLQVPTLDLLAEELRLAQNALGQITGAFGADDLLGAIFSKFCIGK
ncbi:MAG: tRNA uridine-5-carboxymethylaminomethyl(34) synthesis GTPase MnmE [Rhodoferax sp.]|nr:tRNA uridine-5-carboxymethylaminomethyl(34) synthesis GTPase MnmE [Rhodoferax sp.]